MKRLVHFAVAVGVLPLAACGDDPSFPPQACALIPEQTIHVGETQTVAACFTDPDGQEVTLSATSSDERVVAARIQRSALIIEAVGVGTATVAVTATDPDGQTAEAVFTVTVPNREPEADAIPPVLLPSDQPTAELILTEFFTDPDGQPLMFAAESSDSSIVSATVTDSVLALRGETSGSAVVEVIATDSHGLSATVNLRVTVQLFETLLRDDFDTGLGNWEFFGGADVFIDEGRLAIRPTDVTSVSFIDGPVPHADYWEVSANIEAGPAAFDVWPTLFIQTGEDDIAYLLILFGADFRRITEGAPETNLIVVYGNNQSLTSPPGWHGIFDGIPGRGVAMDVTVRRTSNSIDITVDGESVFRVGAPEDVVPTSITRIGLVSWNATDVTEISSGNISYFDWVQVDGLRRVGEASYAAPRDAANSRRLPVFPLTIGIER